MEGKLPQEQIVSDEKGRFIVAHTPHDKEAGTKAIETLTFGISEPRFINPEGKINIDHLIVESIIKQGFAHPQKSYRCSKNPTLIVLEE